MQQIYVFSLMNKDRGVKRLYDWRRNNRASDDGKSKIRLVSFADLATDSIISANKVGPRLQRGLHPSSD